MSDKLLQFFTYSHLPAHLQAISRPFSDLAQQLMSALPENEERAFALRKLLEAKDCAVRAVLCKSDETATPAASVAAVEQPKPAAPQAPAQPPVARQVTPPPPRRLPGGLGAVKAAAATSTQKPAPQPSQEPPRGNQPPQQRMPSLPNPADEIPF